MVNPNKIDEWENYEVNYIDKNGEPWKTSKAENFYSYWQIYEIDSINEFQKKFLTIKLDTETNEYYLTLNEKLCKLYKLKRESIVEIAAFEPHFRFLCDFIESYNRINRVEFSQSAEFPSVDEVNTFNEKITNISKKISNNHKISTNEVYIFLNKLCTLYFDYEKKGKNKLQELVKSDILYTVKLISYVNGESWQDIASKIENNRRYGNYRYTKRPKNVLDVIFPDERKEIKEKALFALDNRLKEYNKKVFTKYKLNNNDLENLRSFLEDNGLSHFFIFVVDANEEYFKYTYKSRKNIIFLLRNLGIFVEELTKVISLNSNNSGIKNQPNFKDILETICDDKPLMDKFDKLKLGNINDENVEFKIDEYLSTLNSCEQEDFILSNLAISKILRNYYAHNSGQREYFIKKYKWLYSCLVDSIFIIWAMGKKIKPDFDN